MLQTNFVNKIDPAQNERAFFAQRPVVEAVQIPDGESVVVVPQNPSDGRYQGVKFPDLRAAVENEIRFATPDVERAWAVDKLCERAEQGYLKQGYGSSTAKSFALDFRTVLGRNAPEELRRKVLATFQRQRIPASEDGLNRPLTEFLERYAAGIIQPPKYDLDELAGRESLKDLFKLLPLIYRMSGLPTLGKAYGISDVLAAEEGSFGTYEPQSSVFIQPGVDYGSRASIPLISRMAWNQTTKESLYVKYPFVPANMRCVTDVESARVAIKSGLCPIVSYTSYNAKERFAAAEEFGKRAFITVRMENGELELAEKIIRAGGQVHLEVANGNMVRVAERVRYLARKYPESFISVGNVGSAMGYWLMAEAGASVIKLGRGPGAGCTTPKETGISPGQVTLAFECAMVQMYLLFYRGKDVPFNLDGGMSQAGHVVAAAILHAETYMFGSLFARAIESPATVYANPANLLEMLVGYFGESSTDAHKDDDKQIAAGSQGIAGLLPQLGSMESIVRTLAQGIRGAVGDLRARSLAHVIGDNQARFLRFVTPASANETATRLGHQSNVKVVQAGRYRSAPTPE